MALAVSGMMMMETKVKYLCKIVRGKALRQFDLLYSEVKGTNPLTVETIILWLALYFFPVKLLSNQKRAMRCGIRKQCRLKVRRYKASLINLDEYLALLLGEKRPHKIGVTELNGIIINSMPNSWIKQVYVQGYDCESVTVSKSVNMF